MKSENKQVMWCSLLQGRTQGLKNSLSFGAQAHKSFPRTNLLTLDIFGRLSCKDSSFTVLPVSWCSGTAAMNHSGPKWNALFSTEVPFSQIREPQSSSPTLPTLPAVLREGRRHCTLSRIMMALVFQGSRWGVWCYTVLQRHEQLRGDGIPHNQVAENPKNRPSRTLPGGSHCSETNTGLK